MKYRNSNNTPGTKQFPPTNEPVIAAIKNIISIIEQLSLQYSFFNNVRGRQSHDENSSLSVLS